MVGEKILILGGLSGIGAGVAERLGDRSIVWSRRTGVDATDEASLARALRALGEPPFGLVHCVGDFAERPLLATEPALYHELLASNLTSAFLVARTLVPAMCARGRGRVIFFSAAGAEDRRAKTRAPVYFALKAALCSLARSLAVEAGRSGVTVNVVSPGLILHEHSHAESQRRMQHKVPLGRLGSAGDVAAAVEYLLSDAAAYVTGAELTVDGGLAVT
jgi:NAD(P)-dependent dehydrogenase (short-subunit alcohol dehydrogenase family)